MSRRRAALLASGVLVLATSVLPGASPGTSPSARAAAPSRFVTGWIPYWEMDDGDGTIGVKSAPAVFADVSTFSFSAVGATTLQLIGGESPFTQTVTALRAQHITTFATLTDGMPKLGMAAILADPITRAAHVQAIVDLVTTRNLDGIDIDYEKFAFTDGKASWPTTQPLWVQFITDLGVALHAQSKLLAVSVPAIWYDLTTKAVTGYTVYDWANIIDDVDRMRVMVYDWSFSNAGPNAPMTWVNSVIAYAKATIPASIAKMQLGVPAYGYSYAKIETGTCPANTPLGKLSVQTESAAGLAESKGATPTRDVSGEMTFTYTADYKGVLNVSLTPPPYVPPDVIAPVIDDADPTGLKVAVRVMAPGAQVSCTVRRTVYYPDSTSIVQRANAALTAGMSGIAIWALGYESTDLWAALAGIDASHPSTFLGDATLGDVNSASVHPGGVEVVGWAFDPEVEVPVSVQVAVNGGEWSGPILARQRRDDVAATFLGVDAMHGFDVVVPASVAAGDTLCVRALGWGDEAAPRDIGCVTVVDGPGPAPATEVSDNADARAAHGH